MVWYGTVRFACISMQSVRRTVCSILLYLQTAYTDARKTQNTIPYHTCIYIRLPEDEPTSSEHLEDIEN